MGEQIWLSTKNIAPQKMPNSNQNMCVHLKFLNVLVKPFIIQTSLPLCSVALSFMYLY